VKFLTKWENIETDEETVFDVGKGGYPSILPKILPE